jgi:hypothetical protein
MSFKTNVIDYQFQLVVLLIELFFAVKFINLFC